MKTQRRRPSSPSPDSEGSTNNVAQTAPVAGASGPDWQGGAAEEEPGCFLGSGGPVEKAVGPGVGETAFRVAENLYLIHAWADAAEKYEEAWLAPDVEASERGSIAYNLGQCYRHLKDPQRAVAWFKSARARGRKDADKALEDLAGARAKEQTAFAESAMSAEARFRAAEESYAASRWAEAVVGYRDVFASPGIDNAQKGEIAYNLGQCFRHQSLWRQATTWYTRARDLGAAAAVDEHLATCAAKLGVEPGEADRAAEKGASDFQQAETLYDQKQWAKAKEKYLIVWEASVADDPGSVAFNIGQCCRRLNDFAAAWGWYEEAISAGGPSVKASRKEIKEIQGQAEAAFVKAKPDKAETARRAEGERALVQRSAEEFAQAEALYAGGKYREAQKLYQRLWSVGTLENADRSRIAYNVGQCYRLLGDKAAATAWFDEALTLGGLDSHSAKKAEEQIANLREPAWAKAS